MEDIGIVSSEARIWAAVLVGSHSGIEDVWIGSWDSVEYCDVNAKVLSQNVLWCVGDYLENCVSKAWTEYRGKRYAKAFEILCVGF